MEHFLKTLAHSWHYSAAQYWHLRLLTAILLGPLLAVLYAAIFGRRRG